MPRPKKDDAVSRGREAVRAALQEWGNTLARIEELNREIERKEQERLALSDTLQAAKMSGEPRGTGVGDPTQAAATRSWRERAELDARIAKLFATIAALEDKKLEVDMALLKLPPLEHDVITLRYDKYRLEVYGYWPKIAQKLHITEDYAKKLEAKGVDGLKKLLHF